MLVQSTSHMAWNRQPGLYIQVNATKPYNATDKAPPIATIGYQPNPQQPHDSKICRFATHSIHVTVPVSDAVGSLASSCEFDIHGIHTNPPTTDWSTNFSGFGFRISFKRRCLNYSRLRCLRSQHCHSEMVLYISAGYVLIKLLMKIKTSSLNMRI